MFLRYPLSLLLIACVLLASCGQKPGKKETVKEPATIADESNNPFEAEEYDPPPSNGASLWDCGEYIDRRNPPDTLKIPK